MIKIHELFAIGVYVIKTPSQDASGYQLFPVYETKDDAVKMGIEWRLGDFQVYEVEEKGMKLVYSS